MIYFDVGTVSSYLDIDFNGNNFIDNKNIKENLEQIDTYITLCLESKNKEFKNLGSPEKSAIRYGFWLLLGPKKMDPPLCSKIAADMVDLFSESSARSLVQGCISWAAKNQQDLALLI